MWDSAVMGFGLRLLPGGSRIWIMLRRPGSTNRYAHLDDATLNQAAERAALAVQR